MICIEFYSIPDSNLNHRQYLLQKVSYRWEQNALNISNILPKILSQLYPILVQNLSNIFVQLKTTHNLMNISQYQDEDVPNYKIIIVGKTQSGKTKLLVRYKLGTYSDAGVMTNGVDNLLIKTPKAKFLYYDTAGQEKYRTIVSTFYKGSDACLLVYDISSPTSFEDLAYYYNVVKETVPDCLIYVVGCKGDLERHVSEQTVYKFYKGYRHEITSAKKNQNVHNMFKALEEELLAKKKKTNKGDRVRATVLNKKPRERRKCCE